MLCHCVLFLFHYKPMPCIVKFNHKFYGRKIRTRSRSLHAWLIIYLFQLRRTHNYVYDHRLGSIAFKTVLNTSFHINCKLTFPIYVSRFPATQMLLAVLNVPRENKVFVYFCQHSLETNFYMLPSAISKTPSFHISGLAYPENNFLNSFTDIPVKNSSIYTFSHFLL